MPPNVRVLSKKHGIFVKRLDLVLATTARIQDSFRDSIGASLILGRMRHVNIHPFCWSFTWIASFPRISGSFQRSPGHEFHSIMIPKTFVMLHDKQTRIHRFETTTVSIKLNSPL